MRPHRSWQYYDDTRLVFPNTVSEETQVLTILWWHQVGLPQYCEWGNTGLDNTMMTPGWSSQYCEWGNTCLYNTMMTPGRSFQYCEWGNTGLDNTMMTPGWSFPILWVRKHRSWQYYDDTRLVFPNTVSEETQVLTILWWHQVGLPILWIRKHRSWQFYDDTRLVFPNTVSEETQVLTILWWHQVGLSQYCEWGNTGLDNTVMMPDWSSQYCEWGNTGLDNTMMSPGWSPNTVNEETQVLTILWWHQVGHSKYCEWGNTGLDNTMMTPGWSFPILWVRKHRSWQYYDDTRWVFPNTVSEETQVLTILWWHQIGLPNIVSEETQVLKILWWHQVVYLVPHVYQ